MMLRTILGLSALLLAGCGTDGIGISNTKAEVEVSPLLLDLGTFAVGESIDFPFQVDHISGNDVDIRNVTVTNVEGSYFAYGDTEDGAFPVNLERQGSIDLLFSYAPLDEGYHRATIDMVHTAEGGRTTVEVRARATVPEVVVAPLGLDFGPVVEADTAARSVTITNNSDLDLQISEASLSNSSFTLLDEVPISVSGGAEKVITVEYFADNEEAATGTLTLLLGDVPLPQVTLRANDCENGAPDEYDVDGDGYTNCGGDCEDGDPNIRPGAVETWDYEDEDCDGDIDEGTAGADDDGDGYCEGPGDCSDGESIPGDCHDGAAGVNPGAREDLDNGIDDDCDGVVDLGTTDTDLDGYSPEGGDCDDTEPAMYPGAPEQADGLDNDCDGTIDEGTLFYDDDGDGYCEGPTCSDGTVPGDCDDRDPVGLGSNPGAAEAPDWQDNNCNGIVDEGTVNYDDDGDGFTEEGGDCDDDDPLLSPALGTC